MSDASHSTRGYGTLGEITNMIARTAYTQLGYSPLLLAGCVLGLGLIFFLPPILTFTGGWPALLQYRLARHVRDLRPHAPLYRQPILLALCCRSQPPFTSGPPSSPPGGTIEGEAARGRDEHSAAD